MESKAIARFARIAPRKARVVVNLVRGTNVAQALDVLTFTRKSGAPIVKKLIESAIANAKQADSSVDVDGLYVTTAAVDKGPNKHVRRWRPRAMGRATKVTKGVSYIQIVLTNTPPAPKGRRAHTAPRTPAEASTTTAATTTTTAESAQ